MALLKRVGTVFSWTLFSRGLGLIRDRLLGSMFGASTVLDAFMLAFALPNLLRNLFGEGALSAAFIPRYIRLRQQDPQQASAFAGLVGTRLLILLSLIAAAGMMIAGIILLYAGPRASLVASLALPQIPYLIFICLAALQAGILNAHHHFAVPAAAPVLLNMMLIGAVLLFPSIEVLPYAVVITGALQLLAHLFALRVQRIPLPVRVTTTPALRDMRRALAPTLLAAGVHQLNAFIDSLIAYVMLAASPGAVTILYFGNRLLQFPMALVGHAVGTAAYPDLSTAAAKGWGELGAVLRQGSGILAVLLLPAGVGLLLVADPLVRTVYQVGAFDNDAAERTILVTQIYGAALLPLALGKLLVRCFHASLDQKTPVRVSLVAVGLNVCLNLILVQTPLREAGLALATLLSGTIACLTYVIILYRRGAGLAVAPKALFFPFCASAGMAVSVGGVLWWWPADPTAQTLSHAMRLMLAVGTGIICYGCLLIPARRHLRRSN